MHELDRAVCVACQFAQHGNDCLDAAVVVFVDEVCAYKRIKDDCADFVLLHNADHRVQHVVVYDEAVPAFCCQRDLYGILTVHEQAAFDFLWLDVVVLHSCDCPHLHFTEGVFKVDDPDVCLLFHWHAEQVFACRDCYAFHNNLGSLTDAACRGCDADVLLDVVVAVNPLALWQC